MVGVSYGWNTMTMAYKGTLSVNASYICIAKGNSSHDGWNVAGMSNQWTLISLHILCFV